MNIGSGNAYPANALSNFSPHPFVYWDVKIASMEGFLQSLKFDKPHIQVEVCKLVGRAAKMRGKARNKAWQTKQTLWWKDVAYPRDSAAYTNLVYGAYRSMYEQSASFRNALGASGKSVFKHTIGHNDSSKTVLTEKEFCYFLTILRSLEHEN